MNDLANTLKMKVTNAFGNSAPVHLPQQELLIGA